MSKVAGKQLRKPALKLLILDIKSRFACGEFNLI